MDTTTDADFDILSWHDNLIYALRFDIGDAAQGDWRSDLVFDIDHIVEWVSGSDGTMRFRVAPATLTFHQVSDLRVAVDFGDSGGINMIGELSIAVITREPLVLKDRPGAPLFYRWRIELNQPRGGDIVFGAGGFTQTPRADPVVLDQQRLPAAGRPRLRL